jgi:hypothetical protein
MASNKLLCMQNVYIHTTRTGYLSRYHTDSKSTTLKANIAGIQKCKQANIIQVYLWVQTRVRRFFGKPKKPDVF